MSLLTSAGHAQRKSGGNVTNALRSEIERRAIEACRQTRDDAVRLLTSINDGGDTYFDRSDAAADVDVTKDHARFFQSVIDRMDIALAAFEADAAVSR
jgi:hypothetical protein